MLKNLLAEESGIDDFSSDGFYEFLEQFKVRSLVTKRKIKEKDQRLLLEKGWSKRSKIANDCSWLLISAGVTGDCETKRTQKWQDPYWSIG